MQSRCYYSQILLKLDISRQIFEKYTNIKSHSSRVDPYGRTDRHGELTVAFPQSLSYFLNNTLDITLPLHLGPLICLFPTGLLSHFYAQLNVFNYNRLTCLVKSINYGDEVTRRHTSE